MSDLPFLHAEASRQLAANPRSADAHAAVGWFALQAGELATAARHYGDALALDPAHRPALAGLGAIRLQQGEARAAHALFTRCVAAHPWSAEDWCNLGGACVQLGCWDEAEAAYRRSVAANPACDGGHQGLVWLFRTRDDDAKLRPAVSAWAAASPQHPVAAHLAMALGGMPVAPRCSEAFVASYFDDFARDYDRVLAQLQTRVAATFAALWLELGITAGSVLDLGCGTGAASAWLGDAPRRIVGVDLSAGMLAHAARSGLYAELHCVDALAFLMAPCARFEAIVVADVVPYFGELGPLFAAMRSNLAADGHVLLSFESSSQPGFRLAPNGRYQHHPDAVRDTASRHGFVVAHWCDTMLRLEAGRPVEGVCAVLRASA